MRTSTSSRADAALASSLRLSVMRLARRLRLERSGDDRTLNQLAVLGTLDRRGPQSVGQLAALEKVKPPSMTRTVACLEEAGLVTRRPHDRDGRQVVVDLTRRRTRGAGRRPPPARRLAGPAPRRPGPGRAGAAAARGAAARAARRIMILPRRMQLPRPAWPGNAVMRTGSLSRRMHCRGLRGRGTQ